MTTVNIHTQVADVLAAARALIVMAKRRRSAVLAIYDAAHLNPMLQSAARTALLDVTGTSSLGWWECQSGRTKEEVLAAFETAEANERRRAGA